MEFVQNLAAELTDPGTGSEALLPLLVPACALVVVIAVLLALAIRRSRKRKRARAYAEAFRNAYSESREVTAALEAGRDVYKKKNGKEAAAIAAALDHISHSILRDYRTAFKKVEAVVPGKAVKEAHKEVLEQEQKAKENILLLTVKND